MTIADKIKEIRKEEDVSQEEFSVMLEVTRQTISNWENGTAVPRRSQLDKIFEVFKVDLSPYLPLGQEKNTEEKASFDNQKTQDSALVADRSDGKKSKKRILRTVVIASVILVALIAIMALFIFNWGQPSSDENGSVILDIGWSSSVDVPGMIIFFVICAAIIVFTVFMAKMIKKYRMKKRRKENETKKD